MKLKDHINQKLPQGISDEEAIDMIIEDMLEDITNMFPPEKEHEVLVNIVEKLKILQGSYE